MKISEKTPPKNNEVVGELMDKYMKSDIKSIQRQIVNHVEYTLARTRFNFDNYGAYQAVAYSVRDRLVESWNDTELFHRVSHISFYAFNFDHNFRRMILKGSIYSLWST